MLIIPLWFSFNNFIKYARLYPSSFSIALYLTCQSFSTTLPSRYGRRWGVGFHSSRSIKTIQGKEGKKGGRNKLTNEREMINEMCMADMIAQFPWRLPWNKFFSTWGIFVVLYQNQLNEVFAKIQSPASWLKPTN